MRVVVVGAGAGGSFTALLLARRGHEVVVLEQDRCEPVADVEWAAARAFRTSAPQIVQPHMMMARCRTLLREQLPDVYDALLAAGAVEVPLSTQMPASLSDRPRKPGDDDLVSVATRRSTLDWVLQRALMSEPGITVKVGVRAVGLLGRRREAVHVCGIRTNVGDVTADVVIDAAGRRSPVDRWLEEIGARSGTTRSAECGLAYFSRHYRVRPDVTLPGPPTRRTLIALDEFAVGSWGGDNDTMQLAVVPLAADRRFRRVKDPDAFTDVLRAVAPFDAWLEALEPISAVYQMAGLRNTLRRLVADGTFVATGLHAVADSVCTTNPTLGRGLTLALITAVDLSDALADHPEDPAAQARQMDYCVVDHVGPFYEDQAAIDEERLAILRHNVFGAPRPAQSNPREDRVTYSELRTAGLVDSVAFRAFWQVQGMTRLPETVYTDEEVISRTRRALREHAFSAA